METQPLVHELDRFDVRLFTLGGTPITLWDLGFVVVALIALFVFANALKRWLVKRLMSRTHLDQGTRLAIGSLVRYTTLVIGFVMIMQAAGINLTTFNVLAGAIGVGIGFGLQNIVSNFISGLIIMFERPVKPGDRIDVAGVEGSVIEIGARSTTVLTTDNVAALVPNQKFITETVKNYRHGDNLWQLRMAITVHHDTDPQAVREGLLAVAGANGDVARDPPPIVRLTALTGGSLGFELRMQTALPVAQHADLLSALNFELLAELGRRGVKLA